MECNCHSGSKKLFKLKEKDRNGLIATFASNNEKGRYTSCCFNNNYQILACTEINGTILLVDFLLGKHWNLPTTISNFFIKFAQCQDSDLFLATDTGLIYIINIYNGSLIGNLIGHKHPVKCISFTNTNCCLTTTEYEAIIWDLTTYTKTYVLSIFGACALKHAYFMPVSNNILATFNDNSLQVWKYNTLETVVELEPGQWQNRILKSIAFTKNGQIMVVACHPNYLTVFITSIWKLIKQITLAQSISIKHIEFIPRLNDGGCNKILGILTGNGTLLFFDIEENRIISILCACCEVIRFDISSNYIACVLCSGVVNLYDLIHFLTEEQTEETVTCKDLQQVCPPKPILYHLRQCKDKMGAVKKQIHDLLDIDKMKLILKEFGQYPDNYRIKIWQELLQLPLNKSQYNAVINYRKIYSFCNLKQKYPLESVCSLRNLRKALDNLVSWSPFFAHVDYLPVFVFPFIKIFQNNPLVCFEALCTIIVNWCQFWFEYFPMAPMNILAMIENLLFEHDPVLLNHLTVNKIPSKLYAWPLLETAFSQTLNTDQWKQFWDHVLTNHPSFLICATAAYQIVQRSTILSLREYKAFENFYCMQYAVDVNKFIKKSYYIYNTTSNIYHPKQYINAFTKLSAKEYPLFSDYPKTVIDYLGNQEQYMESHIYQMQQEQNEFVKQQMEEYNQRKANEIREEEKKRILEMEQVIQNNLLHEQQDLNTYLQNISKLKKNIGNENKEILKLTENKLTEGNRKNLLKHLDCVNNSVVFSKASNDFLKGKTEDELLTDYAQLTRIKLKVQNNLKNNSEDESIFTEQQRMLTDQIKKVRGLNNSESYLQLLNFITSIETLDQLICNLKIHLQKLQSNKEYSVGEDTKLKAHALDLIEELSKAKCAINGCRLNNENTANIALL